MWKGKNSGRTQFVYICMYSICMYFKLSIYLSLTSQFIIGGYIYKKKQTNRQIHTHIQTHTQTAHTQTCDFTLHFYVWLRRLYGECAVDTQLLKYNFVSTEKLSCSHTVFFGLEKMRASFFHQSGFFYWWISINKMNGREKLKYMIAVYGRKMLWCVFVVVGVYL